ncbi:MAG: FG-GAP-like repeat-containing protein, partial [Chloroflexi bacterium]|nr:FG-GAP-like repeat-containing protein [Chloroflexota bacterium]
LLGDVDGDDDRDLLVGNLGQPNRLYLNNGAGVFGPGSNVGPDGRFTSSLALGDVDRDGSPDVVAGSVRPSIGVSGSASSLNLNHAVEAFIGAGATVEEVSRSPSVEAGRTVRVDADAAVAISAVVGAAAGGGTTGVGLSAANANLARSVRAFIGFAEVSTSGAGAVPGVPHGAIVEATSREDILSFAAGRGDGGDLALGASAVLNRVGSEDRPSEAVAFIGPGADVNSTVPDSAADQVVSLRAEYTTDVLGVAGAFGQADRAGAAAGLDAALIHKRVQADVGPGSTVTTPGNVRLDAVSRETLDSLVAGASVVDAFGGELSVAGSVSLGRLDTSTEAFVGKGAEVTAGGDVALTADDDATVEARAGVGALGGLLGGAFLVSGAALGAAAAALFKRGTTKAYLDEEAALTARNLSLAALSREDVRPFAVSGDRAGLAGVAGSLNFTALNETTQAFIATGATVNQAGAGTGPGVRVFASDSTTHLGKAGAASASLALGFGAGVDFAAVVKSTEASVSGTVTAGRDVEIKALSREGFTSLSGALEFAVLASLGGASSAQAFDVNTRAFVGDGGTVTSPGNVLVSADDATEIDVIAGAAGAASVSAGASVGAVVVEKTTEAFIGEGAVVTARGTGPGIAAHTGEFDVAFAAQADAEGEVKAPLQDLATLLNPVGDAIDGVLGAVFDGTDAVGNFLVDLVNFLSPLNLPPIDSEGIVRGFGEILLDLVTSADLPVLDPSLVAQRTVTPRTRTVQGLAVTAVSRDDVESLTVGFGASSLAAVGLSGSAAVLASQTSASIDDNAKVNEDQTGTGAGQSVLVAAGSDSSHMGIAGVAALAGLVSVGPAAGLTSVDNTTEAAIEDGAVVNARHGVDVLAAAREDVLSIAGGFSAAPVAAALAGSLPVISIDSRTHAVVNGTVNTDGNVLVSARDDTDADVIAGAAGLGRGAGLGVSAGLTVIGKDTRAGIGGSAVVDARGLTAPTLRAFNGEMGATFLTEDVHGVVVQAASAEDVLAIAASGAAGSGVGLSGAVTVEVVDSDTTAFIAGSARVNTGAGAGPAQAVKVSAVNDARVYGLAVGLGGGDVVTLAGALDLGIVRNDTVALVGGTAEVRARQDVGVHAASRTHVDSLVGSFGSTAGIGLAASASLYSVRGDLTRVPEVGDLTGVQEANEVQDYIDDQVRLTTNPAGASIGDLLADLADVVGGTEGVVEAVTLAAPEGAVEDALENVEVDQGTSAIVEGATVSAGRDVEVTAREHTDTVLDSSFSYNFAVGESTSPLPLEINFGRLSTGGGARAVVRGGAEVSADRNVVVQGTVTSAGDVAGMLAFNRTESTAGAAVEGATVDAAGSVALDATTRANVKYSALLPSKAGLQLKISENTFRNTTDAHVSGDATVRGGGPVRVTALDEGVVVVIATAVTGLGDGIFGVFPAVGAAVVNNDIADTTTAFVDDSAVTSEGDEVLVSATTTPLLVSVAVGVAQQDNIAAGGSVSLNRVANTTDAHVSNGLRVTENAAVTAAGAVRVLATDRSNVIAISGGAAVFTQDGVGIAFATNSVANHVLSFVDDSDVTSTGGDVEVAATSTPALRALAIGLGQASRVIAGGWSVPFNDVACLVEADARNGAELEAAGAVRLAATSAPQLDAAAGGGAIGLGVAGVGISNAKNTIADRALSSAAGATLSAPTVEVEATTAAGLNSLAAGGAGAAMFALAGSFSLNTINNTADARVRAGSVVEETSVLRVTATDSSTIAALAGA